MPAGPVTGESCGQIILSYGHFVTMANLAYFASAALYYSLMVQRITPLFFDGMKPIMRYRAVFRRIASADPLPTLGDYINFPLLRIELYNHLTEVNPPCLALDDFNVYL